MKQNYAGVPVEVEFLRLMECLSSCTQRRTQGDLRIQPEEFEDAVKNAL